MNIKEFYLIIFTFLIYISKNQNVQKKKKNKNITEQNPEVLFQSIYLYTL